MRILLFPVGSAGDVHPFVAIGRRLVERGHEVTLFGNGHFRDVIEKAGVPFVEADPASDFIEMQDKVDLWKPLKAFKVLFGGQRFGDFLRRHYRLVEQHLVLGETVVVAGSLAFGPRLARDKFSFPLVTVHLQPVVFMSLERTPVFAGGGMRPGYPRWLKRILFWIGDRWIVDPVIGPNLNPLRAELGLPPIRRILTSWMHSPDRVIGLFPDWYCSPASDWPPQTRVTGFPLFDRREDKLPEAVTEFLERGPAPVVVTFGSAMKFAAPYFAAAAEALKSLGRRGIFLTPFTEQLPANLPDTIAHFDYVPLGQLLLRSSALIHHGGIGTASQALAAGVPHLVVPFAHDQPDNADRLVRLGVGRTIKPNRFTAKRIVRALKELDSNEVREACTAIAARFEGTDPIGATCELIEAAGDESKVSPPRSSRES